MDGKKLFKKMKDLGYLNSDYAMAEDPSFTYQELVLVTLLRCGGCKDPNFDPDKYESRDKLLDKNCFYAKNYIELYEGSKHNPIVIDKPWENVFVDKNHIKNRKI